MVFKDKSIRKCKINNKEDLGRSFFNALRFQKEQTKVVMFKGPLTRNIFVYININVCVKI